MTALELQKRLKALGFYAGALDGLHGPQTIAAIVAFQRNRGLVQDGIVGRATLAALGAGGAAGPRAPAGVSGPCVDLVKAWEGIEDGDPRTVLLDPYICPADVVTVGWGHALTGRDGKQIRVGSGRTAAQALAEGAEALSRLFGAPAITVAQAESLLSVDLAAFAAVAATAAGEGRFDTRPCEFDALTSLAFNIGAAGFAKSSVRRLHVEGRRIAQGPLDFGRLKTASQAGATGGLAEAFGAWSKGGGKWRLGLFRRRMCEAMVYRGDPLADAVAVARGIH